MSVIAPTHLGPAPFVYIDIDADDAVSALVTVKLNGTATFQLAQSGEIQITGGIIQSEASTWVS